MFSTEADQFLAILALSSDLGLHSEFIKYLDLESHKFDTKHKGRKLPVVFYRKWRQSV